MANDDVYNPPYPPANPPAFYLIIYMKIKQ